jgi:hypothetical protein
VFFSCQLREKRFPFTIPVNFCYLCEESRVLFPSIYDYQLLRGIRESADDGSSLYKILVCKIQLPKNERLDGMERLNLLIAQQPGNDERPLGTGLRLKNSPVSTLSY